MKSYYVRLEVIKEIEVVDCKDFNEAKNYVLEQLRENANFIDDDEVIIKEV